MLTSDLPYPSFVIKPCLPGSTLPTWFHPSPAYLVLSHVLQNLLFSITMAMIQKDYCSTLLLHTHTHIMNVYMYTVSRAMPIHGKRMVWTLDKLCTNFWLGRNAGSSNQNHLIICDTTIELKLIF